MDYKIISMPSFKLVGFQKIFNNKTAYQEIPKFWDEIFEKYVGRDSETPYEKIFVDNHIGEYGVCIDDMNNEKFRYFIAGKYAGGDVLEGMVIYEFPQSDWAVFDCFGPIPEALQSVNTKVFNEWLPKNTEYELSVNANIEWYDLNGKETDRDYHTAIWLPVKKK